MTPLRVLGLSLFFVASLAVALHVALLAAWRFSIEPELEAGRYPEQLDRQTLERFPRPAPHWPTLDANGLRLRAPLGEPVALVRERCATLCQVALETGKLTIFAERLGQTFEQQIVSLTPTRDEVHLFRTPWNNWRSIESLATRASMPNVLPPTERYTATGSRGVVTQFNSNQNNRWVIYAYAAKGLASQKLALSGTTRETLLAMIGSLEFLDVH